MLSSSRVVSVARAPIVIVLQRYSYSQAQQQVKAFLSPLQMSEDPHTLDSSSFHIKTHQNYNSWGMILPELLFSWIDKSTLPPHTSTEQHTQLLWPHESNPYVWASFYTTDWLHKLLPHALCCRNMHRSTKDSLKWTIIHCHAGYMWMVLTIQKERKAGFCSAGWRNRLQ